VPKKLTLGAGRPRPLTIEHWSPIAAIQRGSGGGTLVAFHAQETMRRQLASELGPAGVRVITIVTSGIPESIGSEADPAIAQGIVDAT
jgi:hypothetical protein